MEWISGMNAAVNYLEEHILEEPDLEKLARLSGCSAHHFQRIFTYIGGITLSEYLRRRRMSLVLVDLKNESAKVIDVAQKYGYDSPTAFNRAFQAVHGISPTQERVAGARLKAFPPLVFQMIVKGTQEMNYRIEKKDATSARWLYFSWEQYRSVPPGTLRLMEDPAFIFVYLTKNLPYSFRKVPR